ncbi:MAG TPA: N-acetylmuramic acid 6-phosphate etherase [Acholeplasmataceae bacterium]|nr:N-acetylmuramic acid 6-phosphate etherase [Acholeplasmataceae bacterium]
MVDISKITTELRNENTKNLDLLTTKDLVMTINNEDKKVAYAVEKAIDSIALVVDEVADVFRNGGRLIYIGAGTSGRLGVLDASECPPTFGVSPDMVVGIIAGGDYALKFAVEEVEDSKEAAIEDLKAHNLSDKDILVGLAASGRTPYVIGAVEYAKKIGAKTSCITTSANSKLASIVDFPIEAVTGPETLTGSTRMKSGTAQKMVANMISTGAMVKIGKVYENLMVDVQMTNAKLVSRAIRIITDITKVDVSVAREYLNKYNSVKHAIFAIMSGIEEVEEIDAILENNKGNIRESLNKYK